MTSLGLGVSEVKSPSKRVVTKRSGFERAEVVVHMHTYVIVRLGKTAYDVSGFANKLRRHKQQSKCLLGRTVWMGGTGFPPFPG